MDTNKIAYDLALICTQRYLEEIKRGEVSDTFVFSSGGDLATKAADIFRSFYVDLKYDPNIRRIE